MSLSFDLENVIFLCFRQLPGNSVPLLSSSYSVLPIMIDCFTTYRVNMALYFVGLLCYQACMLLSAGFHVFFCHSEKAYKRWFAMDLAGISIGLFGCYLPAVHLAFYCNQVRRFVKSFLSKVNRNEAPTDNGIRYLTILILFFSILF